MLSQKKGGARSHEYLVVCTLQCLCATVSAFQMEQNGNEALVERRPIEKDRETVYMYSERSVNFCSSAEGGSEMIVKLGEVSYQ